MEALLGAHVPADWPEERFAQLFLTQLREDPNLAPWLARALVLRSEGRMIGHAGFHSAPAPQYLEEFLPGAVPYVRVNVKLGESSKMHILAEAGGRHYITTRDVKVTAGGCGG